MKKLQHTCIHDSIGQCRSSHLDCMKGAATVFKNAANGFVALSTALSNHFHREGTVLFNYTIKWHYLMHLADIAGYINPRLGWNYQGEDLMHRVKVLVQASHSGAAPHQVVNKVMGKYVLGLGLGMVAR